MTNSISFPQWLAANGEGLSLADMTRLEAAFVAGQRFASSGAFVIMADRDKTIDGLKRQRDELHETTNRYLERARKAELERDNWNAAYNRLWWREWEASRKFANVNAQFGKSAISPQAFGMTEEQYENFKAQTDDLAKVRQRYLDGYWSPALFIQQFGRAKRPSGWRWRVGRIKREVWQALVGWFIAIGWGFACGVIVARAFP